MAILTAAFQQALQTESRQTGTLTLGDFPRVVDALTFLTNNIDLVCRTCGCVGDLTVNNNPTATQLPDYTAHIECRSNQHIFASEGYARDSTAAIRNAKLHWAKFS